MKAPENELPHVLWIGGGTCSGKTSISENLVKKYDLAVYHCDDAFEEHRRKATPERHPTFHQAISTIYAEMEWEQFWMRPVDTLLEEEIAIYREEFEMIVEDLLDLPISPRTLAEGCALLPECVAGTLSDARKAIWIIPTEGFQRRTYSQRGEWVQRILKQCTNPEQAFKNWMNRDVAFTKRIASSATCLGFRTLFVDGGRSIEKNTKIVETHFEEFLVT